MGLFFSGDRKTPCGYYKGFRVWGLGQMIGNNWYGDYYITIPRGETRREMKVKDSVCKSIKALKDYVNNHLEELNAMKGET